MAAANEFLRRGFVHANVGAIAEAAGISKKTIYVHFESKHALFVAAAHDGLIKAKLSQALSVADGRTLESVLRRFLRDVLDLALSPRGRAAYRLVMGEAPNFPVLLQAYRSSIEETIIQPLSHWLERQRALGVLDIDDARTCASMLVHMVMSEPLRDAALGGLPVLRPAARTALIRQVVGLFFHGAATQR
ncbi:TetR/AcrR family transcriptional regulator [Sphingomonas abietis]|uniref:TetR/AcrR family transcriptional regulator n=1 Tax=Sphingomonas abietis TaxID=3012344 RepID=A0ABY7NRV4_9SPHN|nr:TetR/AcrR family transcriptional regulator [Sphingomonas abietis]WBO24267.1 TetR/AcrR family transcriptional regulator [Sphingomonas abietis]